MKKKLKCYPTFMERSMTELYTEQIKNDQLRTTTKVS